MIDRGAFHPNVLIQGRNPSDLATLDEIIDSKLAIIVQNHYQHISIKMVTSVKLLCLFH